MLFSKDKCNAHDGIFLVPRFDQKTLLELSFDAITALKFQESVLHIDDDIVVVGDIHGNLIDLLRILDKFGFPPAQRYLFLGDYVDRGEYSVNVLAIVLALLCKYPDSVYLLRGNHETRQANSKYGFLQEIQELYHSSDLWDAFNSTFDYMPVAAVVKKQYFCVHGGISPLLTTVKKINDIRLPIRIVSDGITDLLWSDPSTNYLQFGENERGKGYQFGVEAAGEFLNRNNLKVIIRGHQCVYNGIETNLGSLVVTVFSSSNYVPTGNKCGVIVITDNGYSNKILGTNTIIRKEDAHFFDVVPAKKNDDSIEFINTSRTLLQPLVFTNRRLSANAISQNTSKQMPALQTRKSTIYSTSTRRQSVIKIKSTQLYHIE